MTRLTGEGLLLFGCPQADSDRGTGLLTTFLVAHVAAAPRVMKIPEIWVQDCNGHLVR